MGGYDYRADRATEFILGSDTMKFKLPPRDYLLKRLPHDRIKERLQKYGFPQYCRQCYSEDFITLQWSDYLPEQRRTYLHECTQCGHKWHEELDRYVWGEEQEKYVKNNKYKLSLDILIERIRQSKNKEDE